MTIKKYKRNFLAKVIFRIDFDQITLNQLEMFSEKIKDVFPITEEKKGEEGKVEFNVKTKEFKQTSNPVTTWFFYNEKKTKKIALNSNFLFIEYDKYKNSAELLKDIGFIQSFIEDFNIKTINRMGLRYVNEIKLENKDFLNWNKYINEELIGTLNFATNNKKVLARAMGQMILKEKSSNISFNYGLWNSNFPSEINEKIFVLDFDSYSKFPLDAEGLNLVDLIGKYNQEIQNLFESVIKSELRKILSK